MDSIAAPRSKSDAESYKALQSRGTDVPDEKTYPERKISSTPTLIKISGTDFAVLLSAARTMSAATTIAERINAKSSRETEFWLQAFIFSSVPIRGKLCTPDRLVPSDW